MVGPQRVEADPDDVRPAPACGWLHRSRGNDQLRRRPGSDETCGRPGECGKLDSHLLPAPRREIDILVLPTSGQLGGHLAPEERCRRFVGAAAQVDLHLDRATLLRAVEHPDAEAQMCAGRNRQGIAKTRAGRGDESQPLFAGEDFAQANPGDVGRAGGIEGGEVAAAAQPRRRQDDSRGPRDLRLPTRFEESHAALFGFRAWAREAGETDEKRAGSTESFRQNAPRK